MKNLKKNSEIVKRWILVGLSLFILAISIAFIALSFGYADDGYGTDISFNMDYVVFLLCGIAMLCYSIYSVIGYYKNKNLKMAYYSAFGVISVLLAFYPLGVFFKAMSKHKPFLEYQEYLYIGILGIGLIAYLLFQFLSDQQTEE